jgi:hypothetical protein
MNCKFCSTSFTRKDSLIKHLKDNRCEVAKTMTPLDYHNKFKELNPIQEIQPEIHPENQPEIQPEIQPENQLTFDGVFSGREKEIRITPAKMISVFDFIKIVGGQSHPRKTWERILNEHSAELGIVSKCHYAQFGKTKATPVVNVQGMVKLLFWLPGETAKQFRSKSAEVMIRYLGGDQELVDELNILIRLKKL